MKIISKEALTVGGLYGVTSLSLGLFSEFLASLSFYLFFFALIMLCFNRVPKFIEALQNNYPKITIYLQYFGIPTYLVIFLTLGLLLFVLLFPRWVEVNLNLEETKFVAIGIVFNFVIYGSALGMATYKAFFAKENKQLS